MQNRSVVFLEKQLNDLDPSVWASWLEDQCKTHGTPTVFSAVGRRLT